MTGQLVVLRRPRVLRPLLLLTAAVVACSPIPDIAAPSVSPTAVGEAELVDVPTWKGSSARTGEQPGPGPSGAPVVLWEISVPAPITAAPLIWDGRVVVSAQDGVVRSVDAETGESSTVDLRAGVTSTPTIADGTLYVITNDGVLRTVSLEDLSLGWTTSGLLPESIVTVTSDTVVTGAAGEVVAVATGDGRELWRAPVGGSDRVAVAGDTAYVGGDGSGVLTAVAVGGGKERWRRETGAAQVLTPAVLDGRVYVAARDVPAGRNVVLAFDSDGSELWEWVPAGEERIGGTAVAGDRVLVSIDTPRGVLYGLDRVTGTVAWRQSFEGQIVGVPVVAGDAMYVAGNEIGLVAVDVASGDVRWQTGIGPIEATGVAVSGGLVVLTTRDAGGGGRILALADPGDPRIARAGPRPSAGASRDTASSGPSASAQPGLRILSADRVEGPSLLLGTSLAPDGTMYVTDMANHRIVIREPDGTIATWGEKGSGPGQFDFSEVTENDGAAGVSVAPDGKLIAVGDGGNHRVQLFDGNGRWLRTFGRIGRGDGQFVNPACVTVDGQHRIWVVDPARHDGQLFDETGSHLLTFGAPGRGDGELSRPACAFVDEARDEVLVPDFANRRVSIFSTQGTWLRHVTGDPPNGFYLDEVNAVVADQAGRLFVLDTSSRIFVVAPTGELLATISNDMPEIGGVELASFALDGDGRLYFADIGGGIAGRLVIAQLEQPLWAPPP